MNAILELEKIERSETLTEKTYLNLKKLLMTGKLSPGEKITGRTSKATANVVAANTTVITFKHHRDTNDIANNNVSSSFSNGETITGSSSGSTAVAATAETIVTFGDVDNRYIPINDSIIGVTGIFDIQDVGGTNRTSDLFSFRYQFHLNEMPYLTATSVINYKMSMQHLSLLNDMFAGKKPVRFSRHQNRLYLDIDWEQDDIKVDEYIIAECYRIIDPANFLFVHQVRRHDHYFFPRAAVALSAASNSDSSKH